MMVVIIHLHSEGSSIKEEICFISCARLVRRRSLYSDVSFDMKRFVAFSSETCIDSNSTFLSFLIFAITES